jgi:transposase
MKLKPNFSNTEMKVDELGHHGLVAALINKLRIVEHADSLMPKISNNSGISHGKIIKAMILNGLGFTERRLYMVSSFFEHKPIDKLLGEEVKAEDLNDDQIGRTLDAIYNFGCTELFFYLSSEILSELKLYNPFAHLDSSTFSLTGKYDINENEVVIKHGHSKDHRPDLKQITLNLAVTGKEGIPFWMEALPGNSSDMVSFHKTIEKYKKFNEELGKSNSPIWVADAALYSRKYLLKNEQSFFWITRVPDRIKLARSTVVCHDENFTWKTIKEGHKICDLGIVEIEGVKQRWVMVFSQDAHERETTTLDINIAKEEELAKKKIKTLKNKIFKSKEEAENELKLFKKTLLYQYISNKEISPLYKEPKKKTSLKKNKKILLGYKLDILTLIDEKAIQLKNNSKGRYIISTNYLDKISLTNEDIISKYKDQSKVERGFRFLKDPSFFVSDIYIKNQNRIQSLLFIMSLTLLVYNYGQSLIRKKFSEANKTIPNQVKKQTSNPTLKWIFQTMTKIMQVCLRINDKEEVVQVHNVKDYHRTVLECIGEEALEIYGFQ